MFFFEWIKPKKVHIKGAENRRFPRFDVRNMPRLGLGVEGQCETIGINDISRGGISVNWDDPQPEGTQKLLHLFLHGVDLGVIGGIVSKHQGRTGYRLLDDHHPGWAAFIGLLEAGRELHGREPKLERVSERTKWRFEGRKDCFVEIIFDQASKKVRRATVRFNREQDSYGIVFDHQVLRVYLVKDGKQNLITSTNENIFALLGATTYLVGARHPRFDSLDLDLIHKLEGQIDYLTALKQKGVKVV